MRLGQLARKLALRPAEIVEFLSQNNILTDEGTNARLEDNHVALVIAKFAPDYKEEIIPEEVIPEAVESLDSHKNEVEITAEIEEEPIDPPMPVMPEVIKAPKVELAGLKVLGKIELPEKKKPVTPPIESTTPETAETVDPKIDKPVEKPRRPTPQRNDRERREVRPRKNPIALQREREAQEEQEKRRAKAKLDKERRTDYYLRKVKSSVPTKAVKLIDEPLEQLSGSELREPPKTLLGRFWRWFTT